MIDKQLFSELEELYAENVKAFEMQNSGYVIDDIRPLRIEDVEKVLNTDEYVDKNYILTHYVSFTINPQITREEQKIATTRVEISPDISWECRK